MKCVFMYMCFYEQGMCVSVCVQSYMEQMNLDLLFWFEFVIYVSLCVCVFACDLYCPCRRASALAMGFPVLFWQTRLEQVNDEQK